MAGLIVGPASVGLAIDSVAMLAPVGLSAPLRAAEPDGPAQLGQVDRREPAQLPTDRYVRRQPYGCVPTMRANGMSPPPHANGDGAHFSAGTVLHLVL